MTFSRFALLIATAWVFLFAPVIEASKAPYSAEQLIASSEIIAVGEIL